MKGKAFPIITEILEIYYY